MNNSASISNFTKFKPASMREVWHLSLPLMLSAASGTLMFFLDRLILAYYSTDALDAATAAGMGIFMFQLGAMGVTSIAEVFVGQHNGTKRYSKLGEPVWQMIWFAIFSIIIFLPVALWGDIILVPEEYRASARYFYFWLMIFGPITALVPALSSFFVGKGQVKIVTVCVIIGNILNVFLDILFIFGWKNYIPELGVEGAAIATIVSQVIQVTILFAVFIKKKNRDKYGTASIKFKPKVFTKCIKIGSPSSIGHMLEMAAWTFVMHILASAGEDYVTVFAVGQGFFVLFTFAIDGLKQGVTAIASNLMGAGKIELIPKLLKSAFFIHLIMVVVLLGPVLLYPEILVKKFLYASHDNPETIDSKIIFAASASILYLSVYFLFDGVVWIIAAILTSAGQTIFILCANAFNAWVFAVVPMLVVLHYNKLGFTTSWQLSMIYGFINAVVFYWRYKSGVWKKNKLLT